MTDNSNVIIPNYIPPVYERHVNDNALTSRSLWVAIIIIAALVIVILLIIFSQPGVSGGNLNDTCSKDSDCRNGTKCDFIVDGGNGICKKRVDQPCEGKSECESAANSCVRGRCATVEYGALDEACPCKDGFRCINNTCKAYTDTPCIRDANCLSEFCELSNDPDAGICRPQPLEWSACPTGQCGTAANGHRLVCLSNPVANPLYWRNRTWNRFHLATISITAIQNYFVFLTPANTIVRYTNDFQNPIQVMANANNVDTIITGRNSNGNITVFGLRRDSNTDITTVYMIDPSTINNNTWTWILVTTVNNYSEPTVADSGEIMFRTLSGHIITNFVTTTVFDTEPNTTVVLGSSLTNYIRITDGIAVWHIDDNLTTQLRAKMAIIAVGAGSAIIQSNKNEMRLVTQRNSSRIPGSAFKFFKAGFIWMLPNPICYLD